MAGTSFWTWNGNNPATYSSTTSSAAKWGSSTPGTSGGSVTYWFDTASNWTEHHIWEHVKLPEGKILIPGVLESKTNFIEHPELIAQRIGRYAKLVGRENVIAGSDCGYGTWVGQAAVDPDVVWAKMAAMAEGARVRHRPSQDVEIGGVDQDRVLRRLHARRVALVDDVYTTGSTATACATAGAGHASPLRAGNAHSSATALDSGCRVADFRRAGATCKTTPRRDWTKRSTANRKLPHGPRRGTRRRRY